MTENKRLGFTIMQWRTCRAAIKLVQIATKQFTILSIVSEMCLRDQAVVPGDNPYSLRQAPQDLLCSLYNKV